MTLLGAQNSNSYFANSGFFDDVKNTYIYPNFSEMSSTQNSDGSITYTMKGESNGLFLSKEITLASSGYEIRVEDRVKSSNSAPGTNVVPYAVIETEKPQEIDLGLVSKHSFERTR